MSFERTPRYFALARQLNEATRRKIDAEVEISELALAIATEFGHEALGECQLRTPLEMKILRERDCDSEEQKVKDWN